MATRIVVPSLGIDLPVIVGDTGYPLCNVAQYLLGFSNPGQAGHDLPLRPRPRRTCSCRCWTESEDDDGAGMIGALVKLYTADRSCTCTRSTIVKRHATDLSLAYDMPAGQHRLIMQTSEGPHGTIPKLQVAAKPDRRLRGDRRRGAARRRNRRSAATPHFARRCAQIQPIRRKNSSARRAQSRRSAR